MKKPEPSTVKSITATNTGFLTVHDRSLLFSPKTKHDMNMFTTITSVHHIKLMEDNAEPAVAAGGRAAVPIRYTTELSDVAPATTTKRKSD